MSKHSPAFQFYPDEWLSDRDIVLMTPEQEGAYIRLICYCWMDKDYSIPNDDHQLTVLSRLNKGGLQMVKAKFIQHPTKDGFLTHKRLIKEAEKQAAWREKSAKGGIASSMQRSKNKGKNKGGSTNTLTKVEPKGNTPIPTPTPFNYKPPYPQNNKKNGVLKNNFSEGSFKIENLLSESAWMDARSHAPGWDIHHLAKIYNQKINSGDREIPTHPNKAFPMWCKLYTKGKKP